MCGWGGGSAGGDIDGSCGSVRNEVCSYFGIQGDLGSNACFDWHAHASAKFLPDIRNPGFRVAIMDGDSDAEPRLGESGGVGSCWETVVLLPGFDCWKEGRSATCRPRSDASSLRVG